MTKPLHPFAARRLALFAGLIAALLCGAAGRAALVDPAAGEATPWQGYVHSFPDPAQIPLLTNLGLAIDSPARLTAFVRVMDAAGIAPQALSARPADKQAAMVAVAVADYSAMTVRSLHGDASPSTQDLEAYRRRFEDLASVSVLVPAELRPQIQSVHRDVEAMIGARSQERSDEIERRVAMVANAWSEHAVDDDFMRTARPRDDADVAAAVHRASDQVRAYQTAPSPGAPVEREGSPPRLVPRLARFAQAAGLQNARPAPPEPAADDATARRPTGSFFDRLERALGFAPTPSKKQAVPRTADGELQRIVQRYSMAPTPSGVSLLFKEPKGTARVLVDSEEKAVLLVRAYEASGSHDILALRVATPDRRSVRFDPNSPITFGIESEMSMADNPNIVLDYRLPSVPKDEWLKMSVAQRVKRARAAEGQPRRRDQTFLVKMPGAAKELPARIVSETGGTFEMNGMVFDSFQQTKDFVEFLVQRYGPASFQGHVAYKNYTSVQGVAGYSIFEGDAAQLQSLERNYERSLDDPSVVPGRNLVHHSLGPLGESSRGQFLQWERSAVYGHYDEVNGKSTTYTTAFRGAIYGEAGLGHELRQYHKRYGEMLQDMDRLSQHMLYSGDFRAFMPFKDMNLIWAALPAQRAEQLGVRIDEEAWARFFKKVGDEIFSRQPMFNGTPASERFFFPLRYWRNHPVVQGLAPAERRAAQERIDKASRRFLRSVNALIAKRGNAPVDDALIVSLQTAVAQWAYETRLSRYFDDFRSRTLTGAGPRGPPLVGELPFVGGAFRTEDPLGLPSEVKKFPGGRPYVRYRIGPKITPDPVAYAGFMDSTVESIYKDDGYTGHTMLRVGRRIYAYNTVLNATHEDFDLSLMPKKTGYVFRVDPAKIRAIQAQLDKIYYNAEHSNLPPFDIFGLELEIVKNPDGSLRFRSGDRELAGRPYNKNESPISAKLVREDGRIYLQSDDGYEYPVIRRGRKLYAQGLSCAGSAAFVLSKYFGIKIDGDHGAKSLNRELSEGNPDGRAPDAIVDYTE